MYELAQDVAVGWIVARYVGITLGLACAIMYASGFARTCKEYYVSHIMHRDERKMRKLWDRFDYIKQQCANPIDLMTMRASKVVAISMSASTSTPLCADADARHDLTRPIMSRCASMYDITRAYNYCIENIASIGSIHTVLPNMVREDVSLVIIEIDRAVWFSDWCVIIDISRDKQISSIRAHSPTCSFELRAGYINDE